MSIKRDILVRVRIAFLFVVLFSLAIVYKIVKIQIVEGKEWLAKAEEIGLRYLEVPATRGNIYSDKGSLLATSLPFFRLALDPTVVSDEIFNSGIDSLSYLLSDFFLDHSADYYKKKLLDARLSNRKYVRLNSKQINYHNKKTMASWPIFREGRYRGGVIFEKTEQRFKPFGYLAARTIGFINEDKNGAGLEYSFNKQLAGVSGKALFQKISGGTWKPVVNGNEIEPVNGWDIITTIDINLQDVAESSLLKYLQKYDAKYGCVVLMEVKTGEIKALANLGLTESGYLETYNYAIGNQGLTDPGSTFKLASMIALMEEKNIKLSDTIQTGKGRYKFYNETMTDAKDGGYGLLTVQEVFEKSSNIGVSKLVNKHFKSNPQRFIDYMYDLKINQPIGFQIQGEATPYIKTPKDKSWSGVSLPWMSIGYEVQLAPIHTLSLYNAVANNGKMIKPILIKEVKNANNTVEKYVTEVINPKICSDKTLQNLKQMLEGVVEKGTAKNIKSTKYNIAGKTGTAQIVENKRYVRKYYTSFVGYFPVDNPKYSCIVIVDSPKGYYMEGSTTAAPVFKEIADKVYSTDLTLHKTEILKPNNTKGVFPTIKGGNLQDLNYLCNQLGISNHPRTQDDWVKSDVKNNSIHWFSKKVTENLVADVIGFTLKDALFVLENQGLNVTFNGSGRVVSQSQRPGIKLLEGSTVHLELSN